MPDKPPFSLPTMEDVERARGTNGLTLASTFSGCGGSCLGFELAGFQVVFASEFVPAAAEVYRLNHPGVHVDEGDIRTLRGQTILETAGGSVDVLEGSPPCASFSTAGARERHWGKSKRYSEREQRTDDLFGEFARLVGEVRPRAFVAENVSGLVKGVSKGYFKEIHAALASEGYRVAARLLDAQWLGVPQKRQRVFFVGFRKDVPAPPPPEWFPSPLPYRYSIREALPELAGVGARAGSGFAEREVADEPAPAVWASGDKRDQFRVVGGWHAPFDSKGEEFPLDEPAPTVLGNRTTQQFRIEENVSFRGFAIEREWRKLRQGETSERYLNLVRSHEDRPAPTVTATGGTSPGTAALTHPSEPRKFSIAELKVLCGFPSDFQLVGSFGQQWERLGRAVPPPMARAVAERVARALLSEAGG
jgi:DNA (cytosine-5)-methyltransferase 1